LRQFLDHQSNFRSFFRFKRLANRTSTISALSTLKPTATMKFAVIISIIFVQLLSVDVEAQSPCKFACDLWIWFLIKFFWADIPQMHYQQRQIPQLRQRQANPYSLPYSIPYSQNPLLNVAYSQNPQLQWQKRQSLQAYSQIPQLQWQQRHSLEAYSQIPQFTERVADANPDPEPIGIGAIARAIGSIGEIVGAVHTVHTVATG